MNRCKCIWSRIHEYMYVRTYVRTYIRTYVHPCVAYRFLVENTYVGTYVHASMNKCRMPPAPLPSFLNGWCWAPRRTPRRAVRDKARRDHYDRMIRDFWTTQQKQAWWMVRLEWHGNEVFEFWNSCHSEGVIKRWRWPSIGSQPHECIGS